MVSIGAPTPSVCGAFWHHSVLEEGGVRWVKVDAGSHETLFRSRPGGASMIHELLVDIMQGFVARSYVYDAMVESIDGHM